MKKLKGDKWVANPYKKKPFCEVCKKKITYVDKPKGE